MRRLVERLWRCTNCDYEDRGAYKMWDHGMAHVRADEILFEVLGERPTTVYPIVFEDIETEDT